MGYTFSPILAVIPARYGSKRLPQKNVRKFLGRSLISHSILFARRTPEIDQRVVTTDSILVQAIAHANETENLDRPAELATDDAPMWPVMQHALQEMERIDRREYGAVLLLQPTSPIRYRSDLLAMMRKLNYNPKAAGIISVTNGEANGVFYLYTREHILNPSDAATILEYRLPESKAIDINTEEDFLGAERSLRCGFNHLPWVELQQDA